MTANPLWHSPLLEGRHRDLAADLLTLDLPVQHETAGDLEAPCRALAATMAARGLLDIVVPPGAERGGVRIDVRALCIAREVLGYRNVLADSVFTMQGIGTAALWLHGSDALRARYLPGARAGTAIAGFALSEPEAGSDVGAMTTSARRDGGSYVISGEKTWITNAPFADHYMVVARTGEAPGSRGLSAFIVDAGTPGLVPGEPIAFGAPHAAARLVFDECRVPAECMVGPAGQGFKVAMSTFDIFRASVGAAAVGVGRRAFDETLDRVTTRRMFGKAMAEIEGVQAKLADMAAELTTAGLTVYHAAWAKDTTGGRCSREMAMAKLVATEAAQRVVDAAVQLHGGAGVARGSVVEALYREVRPMRIYEGASEVQKLIIARDILKQAKDAAAG